MYWLDGNHIYILDDLINKLNCIYQIQNFKNFKILKINELLSLENLNFKNCSFIYLYDTKLKMIEIKNNIFDKINLNFIDTEKSLIDDFFNEKLSIKNYLNKYLLLDNNINIHKSLNKIKKIVNNSTNKLYLPLEIIVKSENLFVEFELYNYNTNLNQIDFDLNDLVIYQHHPNINFQKQEKFKKYIRKVYE